MYLGIRLGWKRLGRVMVGVALVLVLLCGRGRKQRVRVREPSLELGEGVNGWWLVLREGKLSLFKRKRFHSALFFLVSNLVFLPSNAVLFGNVAQMQDLVQMIDFFLQGGVFLLQGTFHSVFHF